MKGGCKEWKKSQKGSGGGYYYIPIDRGARASVDYGAIREKPNESGSCEHRLQRRRSKNKGGRTGNWREGEGSDGEGAGGRDRGGGKMKNRGERAGPVLFLPGA